MQSDTMKPIFPKASSAPVVWKPFDVLDKVTAVSAEEIPDRTAVVAIINPFRQRYQACMKSKKHTFCQQGTGNCTKCIHNSQGNELELEHHNPSLICKHRNQNLWVSYVVPFDMIKRGPSIDYFVRIVCDDLILSTTVAVTLSCFALVSLQYYSPGWLVWIFTWSTFIDMD